MNNTCAYSARHVYEGVPAVTEINCGPVVGMVAACQACADLYARLSAVPGKEKADTAWKPIVGEYVTVKGPRSASYSGEVRRADPSGKWLTVRIVGTKSYRRARIEWAEKVSLSAQRYSGRAKP